MDEKIKWKKIKDAGNHKLLSDFKNPFEIDSDDNSSFAEACARLKKTGVKSGVPDITVVYDGMYYGLEVKRPATDKHPKGYLTQSQKDMHEQIRKVGGSVATVYSVADVILWLNTEVMYEVKL